MIDLNDFPAKAHALLALAQTHAVARMKYDGDAHEIARTLVRFGYMRWDGYNYVTNEARYILTDTGRAWLEAQHAPEVKP